MVVSIVMGDPQARRMVYISWKILWKNGLMTRGTPICGTPIFCYWYYMLHGSNANFDILSRQLIIRQRNPMFVADLPICSYWWGLPSERLDYRRVSISVHPNWTSFLESLGISLRVVRTSPAVTEVWLAGFRRTLPGYQHDGEYSAVGHRNAAFVQKKW